MEMMDGWRMEERGRMVGVKQPQKKKSSVTGKKIKKEEK